MITKEKILSEARDQGKVFTSDLTRRYSVSRQYVNRLIRKLIDSGQLVKIGTTKNAYFVSPEYAKQHPEPGRFAFTKEYINEGLAEDKILAEVEDSLSKRIRLPENIRRIFRFAFMEMLNNAIEHSQSEKIDVKVEIDHEKVSFTVQDYGVGVFRNVMKERNLTSELEAIQDILKGKTSTMPADRGGEGIFFTSRCADFFTLDSYGYQLLVDNQIPDIFIRKVDDIRHGTLVNFKIDVDSNRQLFEVFRAFTDEENEERSAFNVTEIKVKLYKSGTEYISRSQARRILAGLDQFRVIRFDFDHVEMIGQAFADEVFRVFHNQHPDIRLEMENMNDVVSFMIKRAVGKQTSMA
ncbi:MAG: DUF4325 domain-containing protein [Anaerolineaceae bacterium]